MNSKLEEKFNKCREDAFIDLDKFLLENKYDDVKILQQQTSVKEYFCNDGGIIYKPQTDLYECYVEVIMYNLAKLLNIDCAYYDLGFDSDTIGNITIDFKKENYNYYSLTNIIDDYTKFYKGRHSSIEVMVYTINLENIWDALYSKYYSLDNYEEIVKKLMDQLVEIFCFDLLTINNDRNPNNLIIAESKDLTNISFAPIFDNSLSLNYSKTSRMGVEIDWQEYDHFTLLAKFLSASSIEYLEKFKSMYKKLDISLLKSAIIATEQQINGRLPNKIKEQLVHNFWENRAKFGDVLENYKNKER